MILFPFLLGELIFFSTTLEINTKLLYIIMFSFTLRELTYLAETERQGKKMQDSYVHTGGLATVIMLKRHFIKCQEKYEQNGD
jgi:membrane-bound acyltransferase YfiQ involved in biofilm formation